MQKFPVQFRCSTSFAMAQWHSRRIGNEPTWQIPHLRQVVKVALSREVRGSIDGCRRDKKSLNNAASEEGRRKSQEGSSGKE